MKPTTAGFFGVKVSKAGLPVQDATDKQLIYKDDYSTKTYYDNFNSRMLEGLLPDGTYGIWVSAPNVDVASADPNIPGQLVFDSNRDILKIVQSGVYNYTIPIGAAGIADSYSVDIVNHNQPTAPLVMGTILTNDDGILSSLPRVDGNIAAGVITGRGSFGIFFNVNLSITATTVRLLFQFVRNGSGNAIHPSGSVRYYILQETAATS